jgi:TonB family protein
MTTSAGNGDLDVAAVKVARAFRFKPATSEGKPIATCVTLPVKFQLKNDAAGG